MRLKNFLFLFSINIITKIFLKIKFFILLEKLGKPHTTLLGGVTNPAINVYHHHAQWWTWQDLNPLPPACKAGALPDELQAHKEDKDIIFILVPIYNMVYGIICIADRHHYTPCVRVFPRTGDLFHILTHA